MEREFTLLLFFINLKIVFVKNILLARLCGVSLRIVENYAAMALDEGWAEGKDWQDIFVKEILADPNQVFGEIARWKKQEEPFENTAQRLYRRRQARYYHAKTQMWRQERLMRMMKERLDNMRQYYNEE